MAKNSFISNFKSLMIQYRVLILALGLLLVTQFICLRISDITQDGSKQVVKEKRLWAQKGRLNQQTDKSLVLVFGNSKIGAGFYPDVFDQINPGIISYNLSLIGLQLAPHYFLLKDFLKNHRPPDWILLQYSPEGFDVESFPAYAVQAAHLTEVMAYAHYRGNNDVVLNYLIPSRLHWPEVSRYMAARLLRLMPAQVIERFRQFYMQRGDGNAVYGHNRTHFFESQYIHPEKYRKQLLLNLWRQRGYYFIAEQAADGGVISKEYLAKIGVKSQEEEVIGKIEKVIDVDQVTEIAGEPLKPFVKDFFDLALAKGIKIMIINEYQLSHSGTPQSSHNVSEPTINPQIRYLMKQYPNIHLAPKPLVSLKLGYEYFSDPAHVNTAGAKYYTAILANQFKQLTQHLQ